VLLHKIQVRVLLRSFIFLGFLLTSNVYAASKIGVAGGLFNLTAQNGSRETSISNLGSYRLLYSKNMYEKINFIGGYSVIMEDTLGGDVAYGLDFGASYSFHSPSAGSSQFENILIEVVSHWEPFVSITFHQRQFQSIRTSYAGFGIGGGFERAIKKGMWMYFDVRYIQLNGTTTATANEMTTNFGLTFAL
jgi:hypothetical protein